MRGSSPNVPRQGCHCKTLSPHPAASGIKSSRQSRARQAAELQSCRAAELQSCRAAEHSDQAGPAGAAHAHQRPVILTSLGALAPRSVSEGCTDSNTPAISPVTGSTLAMEKTASPFMAAADLLFSFRNSSAGGVWEGVGGLAGGGRGGGRKASP